MADLKSMLGPLLGAHPQVAEQLLAEPLAGITLIDPLSPSHPWHSESLLKHLGLAPEEGAEAPSSVLPFERSPAGISIFQHKNGHFISLFSREFHLPAKNSLPGITLILYHFLPSKLSKYDAERLALVVSKTSNAIIITDSEGKTEWINGGCSHIYGYTLEEMKGRSPGAILQGPDTDPETIQKISHGLQAHEVVNTEILNYHKNGQKVWIDLNITPVWDETGRLSKFISVGRDITEKKIAEARLQENDQMLRLLAAHFPNGSISLIDKTLKLIYTGGLGYARFGADPRQYIGKNMQDTHPPEIVAEVRAHLPLVLAGETISHETKFGGRIYQNNYSPVVNGQKPVEKFVLAVTDITDRKALEEKLLRHQEILNQAETITHAGSWELALETNEIYWSDEVYRICGYEPQAFPVNFERGLSVIHPEDHKAALAAFEETITTGKPYRIEKRFVRKDGSLRDILSTGKLICNEAGKPVKVFGVFQDITEAKKSEMELRRVKEMLDQTNKVARVGGWEYYPDTDTLYWSRITHKIHEVPKNYQPKWASSLQFFKAGTSRDAFNRAIKNAISQGQSFDQELELITHKGNEKWVRAMGRVEKKEGKVQRVFGALYDIDTQKRAEQALAQTNEAYKSLISTIDGIVWEASADSFGFTFVSQKAERLLGYPVDDWTSDPQFWTTHVHPDDREWTAQYCQIQTNKGLSHEMEYRMLTADGRTIWVRDIITVVEEKNRPKMLRGLIIDITSYKEQWEKVQLLQSVVTHTKDSVLITDVGENELGTPKIVYVNEAFCQMTGYTSEEVLGKSPKLLQGPDTDPQVLTQVSQAIAHWQPLEVELINYKKSGEAFWVNFAIAPVANESGWFTHWIAIERDITEKRKSHEALILAKEAAEAANKAKSEFLANMSHEIRTPLNGVIGFSDLMLATTLNPTQSDYMAAIASSAHSLRDMINDILDFSKIEAGKMELFQEPTEVLAICSKALDIVRFTAEEKGLSIQMKISRKVPRMILADGLRLSQVLINLMSNAVKFTETGVVALEVQLAGPPAKNKVHLRFSVEDTGIGIDPENQSRIFSAFVQEDSSTTRKFGGTGLGLTISNKLLELMGSELQLESEPGNGSTFWFDLLVKEAKEPSPTEIIQEVTSVRDTPAPPNRVLIVEDNDINTLLARSMVKSLQPGAHILEAQNGKMALEILKKGPVDLILMDIQMPVMNGYDTCRAIRQMEAPGQRTPIIAVTAGTLKGEKAKCLAAGMDDYLSKPIDKMAMAEIFNKWWKKINPKAPSKKVRSSPLPAQFDVEELKERLQGSPELIKELLAMVPKVLEATLAEMEAAIEAKNWDQLALLAHRTRGNALNMSFHNLAALAEQLRMQVSKDPNALEVLFLAVKKEMQAVTKLARKMEGA